MSTPSIRAALEQWRDLAQTDLLCPANPAETDWGAVVVAIAATHAALAQPGGEGRWSEGVCGDGAAILFDGAMVPIEEVVRALNRTPATPPAPETDDGDVAIDRWIEGRPDWPEGWPGVTQCQLTALIGEALEHWGRPATLPAPEVLAAEVRELVTWLGEGVAKTADEYPDASAKLARAATLLQQQESRAAFLRYVLIDCGQAVGGLVNQSCSDSFLLDVATEVRLAIAKPAPAVVPVAVSERLPGPEDCDEDGFCWMGYGYKLPGVDEKDSYAMWMLMPSEESSGKVWAPANAIPLPQAGEVEA
jgi:hypothetical protein